MGGYGIGKSEEVTISICPGFLCPFAFSAGGLAWSRIFVFLLSMYILLFKDLENEHNYKIIR